MAGSWGVKPSRITALQNTLDTGDLTQAIEHIRFDGPLQIRARLGVGDGPLFAMIGGLDGSKRVSLVVETLDRLWTSRPDVRLVVGGRGQLEPAFDAAVERGQVRLLGYISEDVKADIARVAVALLNPGRVGLIAIDSMAMGIPIITTSGTRHGPEYEYLSPGVDSVECDPTAGALAQAMTRLIDEPTLTAELAAAISSKASSFSLQHMLVQYRAAIDSLLADAARRARRSRM